MTQRLTTLALIAIGFAEAWHYDVLPSLTWFGWLGWAAAAGLAWGAFEFFKGFHPWPRR